MPETSPLPIEQSEVLDLLTSVVNKSLVVFDETSGRYRLLETVRHYAGDLLTETGKEDAATRRTRHRDHFLALTEKAYEKRFTDEAPSLMDLVKREHDNCRAALDFCAASPDAQAHFYQNDPQAARRLFDESGQIARALGEKRLLAIALSNLGMLERQELRYDHSQASLDESLTLMRELNDRDGMSLVLGNMGTLARLQNNVIRARLLLEETVILSRETGNLYVLEEALVVLAQVAMQQGDYATACTQFREALVLCAASHNDMNLIEALEPMAELAVCLERTGHGVRLFAAGVAMRERIGVPIAPDERTEYVYREQLLRAALDAETFAAEWAMGAALTKEESLAQALALTLEDPA